MRVRTLITATTGLIVLIGAGTAGALASVHSSRFNDAATSLQATWDKDEQEGVPAASLKPLRDQLAAQRPPATILSTTWVSTDDLTLVSTLQSKTDAAYAGALANEKQQAQSALDEWAAFAAQQSTWITADASNQAKSWPGQLTQATTPKDLAALAAQWRAFTQSQRKAVADAQAAKLNAELAAAGGPAAILATANRLVSVANAANLDDAGVQHLASTLSLQLEQGLDGTTTAQQLVTAVGSLQALVNLNNQVNAEVRPLMLTIIQAEAEGTPNAASFNSQYNAMTVAFRAARTSDQINAVAQQLSTEQTQVNAELQANQCGHPVGSGKVITVSLTFQEMIFYQDGCVAQAAPTTTGRPQLPTPTGTFHVFYKTSPFHMISPWPLGSPFYYNPTWVQQVMEFDYGGYFIHDAYWESTAAYGPGSQNDLSAASHGCIHIPTPAMQWAYAWTPVGTPVIISA